MICWREIDGYKKDVEVRIGKMQSERDLSELDWVSAREERHMNWDY